MNYDVYLVGVGGQGVLTLGRLLAQAALQVGLPTNFYPTKGMAQRGGFVKAQLRLGREEIGPNMPEKGADLVIAMEVSEAVKAVRFVKPGADFVLYSYVWSPTAVVLGKGDYPALDQVLDAVRAAGARGLCVDPADLPIYVGERVAANVFTLGVALGHTDLASVLEPAMVEDAIRARLKRGLESNLFAFRRGLESAVREC